RGVERRCFDVAIGTDLRSRPLAREKLWSMTIQTSRVFGKLGHVRKRRVAFTNFLPIFGRKFMTRATGEFLFVNVSRVREVCVIDRGGAPASGRALLGCRRSARQSGCNEHKCR